MLFYFIRFVQKVINAHFKILRFIWHWFYKLNILIEAFWLSVLSEKKLYYLLQKFYQKNARYRSDETTTQGPFSWEQKIIDKYPIANSNIVIVGAGGGREAYMLSKIGCQINAFEADLAMANYAKSFFKEKNLPVNFTQLPINTIPSAKCDVFWLGWGVYTHFIGKTKRVEILKEINHNLKENGLIIISFWAEKRNADTIQTVDRIAKKINKRTVELGESFKNGMWAKYYTRTQITEEARLAGLSVDLISNEEYGHAVLKPDNSNQPINLVKNP
ncbi:class I SAM-dependent methyltransferase [Plebeiibacterium marinum]|uniref:Class I SAM-dependent methyltransferase n=1 Tax=Plebeiibacterium marinum TaxID=2992111 RepID=A0AAE3MFN3_9BACT|nr:class I SAM-dependent methyltransferase [Plebeiobacterium marinum]MCW3806742.1 class I SAM-dependent methyltransferase [Plebeiobacterium marinum]